MKIFDAHLHVGTIRERVFRGRNIQPFSQNRDVICSPKEVDQFLARYHVAEAILIPVYGPDEEKVFTESNKFVIACIEKCMRVYGGIYISPNIRAWEKGFMPKAFSYLSHPRVKVAKMVPSNWEGGCNPDPCTWTPSFACNMNRILDQVSSLGLVLQFHCSTGKSDAIYFDRFVRTFGRTLDLHFVHMGMTAEGHFTFVPRFIDWVKEGYQVFCDTSLADGFAIRWLLEELRSLSSPGIQRVLFASDSPFGDAAAELAKIRLLPILNDAEKQLILWNNGQRLYFPESKQREIYSC